MCNPLPWDVVVDFVFELRTKEDDFAMPFFSQGKVISTVKRARVGSRNASYGRINNTRLLQLRMRINNPERHITKDVSK